MATLTPNQSTSDVAPTDQNLRGDNNDRPIDVFEELEEQGHQLDVRMSANQDGGCKPRNQQKKTLKTSYRRPLRDYTTHIEWTCELNRDLFRLYLESKPSVSRYMQRLKDLWDKDHPNLNHLSKKHLREQAVRIRKRVLYEKQIF